MIGDALDAASFAGTLTASDTFVQLTGVAHPAPWKEAQFRAIDQVSRLIWCAIDDLCDFPGVEGLDRAQKKGHARLHHCRYVHRANYGAFEL